MKKEVIKLKTYAFIDSQNLNLGVRSQGWELDWRKFRQYLRNKYNDAFLQECGYILIFKPTITRIDRNGISVVKGNVDAELVMHTMIEYKNYDKAIIVSGDGDFHCLVEYLDVQGKLLKILVPTKRYSGLLRKFNRKLYIVRIDL